MVALDQDLADWAQRCQQRENVSLADMLQVVFALRTTCEDLLQSGDAGQLIEFWRTVLPCFDRIIAGLSEINTQAMERTLTERLQEAAYLNASLVRATEDADRALVQLRSIYDISQTLVTALNNVEDIFSRLVQKLGSALQAHHCALWLNDVGTLHIVAAYDEANVPPITVPEDDKECSLGVVLRSGESQVLCRGETARPGDERLMAGLQADALLVAPLAVQEIPIGVLTLGRGDGDKVFDSTEVDLVESVVSQAAIAIQNAGLYEEIRLLNRSLEERVASRTQELAKEKERIGSLYTLGRELSTTLDLDDVLATTLELVTQAVGAKQGSIVLLDHETDALVYGARLGEHGPLPLNREIFEIDVATWVLQNRETALIDDVSQDERWLSARENALAARSLIAAPLIVGDDVHGVLVISNDLPSVFNESQLQLVAASAQQVAQAMSNARLYNYVRRSADRLGQLLRSEQQERSRTGAILQSIADGVIVNDTQHKVIAFNAAAEEILGAKRENVLGQDVWLLFDVFEENGRNDALAALEAISGSPIASMGQVIETTLEIGRKVISAHMAPVVTENQELLGVVTALRDITREVEADRAKSEWVSTVSHELRTPLTSIKGYTDLIHAGAVGPTNEKQDRFLDIIRNNVDRLTALTSDLLDISHIENGRVKLKSEAVDPVQIVQDVVESLRGQVEEKGLRLELELPDHVDEIVGDRTRLTQIVTNLIYNACKFTDDGWIRVSLSPLGGAVRLDVADSGIGISTEDQSRIFERFYRADTPVMDGRGGAGLGLAITKDLIELHGGRIWVESELGVGSTFTAVLPSATQELPSSILAELPAGAKKILVVDDERDTLALLRHQLATQGYHVITAATGGQAITKAIKEQPDLITLDILLPDRHGFDVLRELRAHAETSHIPVIILSAVQDETNGYRLGAVDYIVKPLDAQRLVHSISHVLSRKDKILIAEDVPDTAEFLIGLLKKQGYEPLHAIDGYETLLAARRERPGLILLDLQMPGMDGYEALTRLKKDPETREIPILVMSAYAADPVQERLKVKTMGAENFLSKPFSVTELLAEIGRVSSGGHQPAKVVDKANNDARDTGKSGTE
jgi:PAS domain S-box-containing protein